MGREPEIILLSSYEVRCVTAERSPQFPSPDLPSYLNKACRDNIVRLYHCTSALQPRVPNVVT
jgi:hypothetical protein